MMENEAEEIDRGGTKENEESFVPRVGRGPSEGWVWHLGPPRAKHSHTPHNRLRDSLSHSPERRKM